MILSTRCKNVLIALIIAIVGSILLLPDRFNVHLRCPFALITGLPCPGCGMTRAVQSLIKGDILQSVFHNPLATPTIASILIVLILLILDIVGGTNRLEKLMNLTWDKKYWIPVAALIIVTWIFNLYKHFALNY